MVRIRPHEVPRRLDAAAAVVGETIAHGAGEHPKTRDEYSQPRWNQMSAILGEGVFLAGKLKCLSRALRRPSNPDERERGKGACRDR